MLKRIAVFVAVFLLTQMLLAVVLGFGGFATLVALGAAGFAAWKVGNGSLATETAQPRDNAKPSLSEFSELRGIEPVRGVWEDINWDNKNFNGIYRCTGDRLEAIGVFVTSDTLFQFSEDKANWEDAVAAPLSDASKLGDQVALAEIRSVEMESSSQFHGVAAREQYVPPKMSGNKELKERHPTLTWDGYGFHDSNTRQAIVYVFTKDGDRIRLFQTWDRDLAVKWRTQVSNRIEAALHAAPVAGKPKDGEPDYM